MSDKSVQVFVLFALPIVSICFWVACLGSDFDMLYAAVGLTALTIVAIPMMVQDRIDWFSPWTFVVLSVALGCAARGVCMSFHWPDEFEIDDLFLLGEGPEFFVAPSIYLLLSLSCLTLGYFLFTFPNARAYRSLRHFRWNVSRMHVVIGAAAIVSVLATLQFIRNTDGLTSEVLSGKRTVIFDVDIQGDEEFNQYGYLRQTAKLANFAYLSLLGYSLFYVRSFSPLRIAVLGILLTVACALPFYSSSRLPIMWVICGSGALFWYSGRRINIRLLVAFACVGIAVFYGMTVIRGKNDARRQLRETKIIDSLVNGLVIHRNFLGISKTAHIVNAVPRVLDYEYGRTIAIWSVSPIPRRLWNNKPLIHSGPVIGSKVYGNNVSGVPPGMVAELFWNFHLFGIILGSFLLGAGLRWIGEVFRPRPGRDLPLTLIYVIGPMRMGFEIAGNTIGFGLMKFVFDASSMAIILLLVLDRQVIGKTIRRTLISGSRMRRAA